MIIGVDPGLMTGVWLMQPDGLITYGDEAPAMDAVAFIDTHASRKGCRIAMERYDIGFNTIKKSRQTDALEVIGAVKYIASLSDKIEIVMQPRNAKSRVTDVALKRIGWWDLADGSPHVHDAQRHALVLAAQDPKRRWEELVKQAFDMV